MRKLGFDPSVEVYDVVRGQILAEVTLERLDDGRLVLRAHEDDTGAEIFTLELRSDFLDEAVAQARAREADAAA